VTLRIPALATRLSHDVATLDGWAIDLVPVNPEETDADGNHQYESAISLSCDGRRRLQLEFFQAEDLKEQILEAINQLQDVIVESNLQAWPPCSEHPHVLVPNWALDDFYWICPEDASLVKRVGDL
jgi:hypothetical protein